MAENYWEFGGELVYIKPQSGEFGASIKIRGTSKRNDASSSQICELTSLVPSDVNMQFKHRGVECYDRVTVSGHIETWRREYDNKIKTKQMFIVDNLLEVSKKKMERNRF